MATWTRIAMRAVRNLVGPHIPSMELPEAATQTFKKGALCVFASGYMQECGVDPVLITGVATQNGLNGATAGAKRQLFELAHPATLWLGFLDTSAAEGAGTSAATDRGLSYGVFKNASSGKWFVDKTDTTAKRVTIWDVWEQYQDNATPAWGDTLTPVLFTIDVNFCNATKVT